MYYTLASSYPSIIVIHYKNANYDGSGGKHILEMPWYGDGCKGMEMEMKVAVVMA